MENGSSGILPPEPQAILPRYMPGSTLGTVRESNERIKPLGETVLYEGQLEVETERGVSSGEGSVSFVWRPEPFLEVYAQYEFEKGPAPGTFPKAKIRLPGQEDFTNLLVTVSNTEPAQRAFAYLMGTATGMTIGSPSIVSKIVFHIPNFPHFSGSRAWFQNPEGSQESTERTTLSYQTWKITLDAAPGYNIFMQHAHESNSVTAITHTGILQNSQDVPFSVSEGKAVLEMLGMWLSFGSGNWTAPVLLTGFDTSGREVWQDWHAPIIKPSRKSGRWPNVQSSQFLEEGFPKFCDLYSKADWKEAITLAISFYVEATRQASGLETSIILSQTGLELLGWAYIVDELKVVSSDGYDKLKAEDKVRILLATCNIPTTIPQHLTAVIEYAKATTSIDGPACTTHLRNKLIHGNSKHRSFITTLRSDIRAEIAKLSIWYVEMVLLKLFNFVGDYNNRLGPMDRYNRAIQPLPWS